ncbi:NAD-dependent epimerase/dehydratase family protein [Candidatus Methylopumilus planktonicus]|uniref:SDR family oxidoreductase n=1 Tax=Candidatus Methylopumilus planktonicus TaxID=1581557 RepID=UPI001120E761|nr:NAD-dependent epimerase/dehydratase family protein [Candidatus Methylopumilus planktonicus]QDD01817.1 NAD-dependent epimerase/dehydratase family protein [Candidatus Methylopumilus planktonicus]
MILITGITGHSGSYFLRHLIDNNYEVPIRCTIRSNSNLSLLDSSNLNIDKVTCDLDDEFSLDNAMLGIDEVFHIGSIFYSRNVVKSALKNKVKRIICVHTTGIYSKFKTASAEYKNIEFDIEKMIKEEKSSIQLIYLRPTMIYGHIGDRNMAIFIKMVDKIRLFPLIDYGKNLLQPVNGKDLGKAYFQLLTNKNITSGDYILSGKDAISMLNMMRTISNYLQKKTIFFNIPLSLGVFLAKLFKLVTFNSFDFIERVQRMGEDRSFSHAEATRDFGYDPMSFSEGLEDEVKEYLNNLSHL